MKKKKKNRSGQKGATPKWKVGMAMTHSSARRPIRTRTAPSGGALAGQPPGRTVCSAVAAGPRGRAEGLVGVQRRQVGQQHAQVAERARVQRLGDAFAELVAGQATLDVVLLQLGDDRLAVDVARAQFGGWPRTARRVHRFHDISRGRARVKIRPGMSDLTGDL